MQRHSREFELAKIYNDQRAFSGLSKLQISQIKNRGKELLHWSKTHVFIHYFIGVFSMLFFLLADYFILLQLPHLILPKGASSPWWSLLLAALVVGTLRGWLVYAILGFSIHEASTHDLVFPRDDGLSKVLNWLACNLSRFFASDPEYYRNVHLSHHSNFGTEKDAQFLNFIFPNRHLMSLLPFAWILNYNDFLTHRSLHITKSYLLSMSLTIIYHVIYAYFMVMSFGVLFTAVTILFVMPHVAFNLDRLRQFSEHNLMPIENINGARSFGPGFWGLFVGGGPWGSPCHWEHHLIPELPWYQTIVLHKRIKEILNPTQKRQFLLTPVIGYPRLLLRLWTEPKEFAEKIEKTGMQLSDKIIPDRG